MLTRTKKVGEETAWYALVHYLQLKETWAELLALTPPGAGPGPCQGLRCVRWLGQHHVLDNSGTWRST